MAPCALFHHIFSFFNGLLVIMICPPEVTLATPSSVSTSTLAPDLCGDLPLTCLDEVDELARDASCSKMESAYKCLEKVIQFCDNRSPGLGPGTDPYYDHDLDYSHVYNDVDYTATYGDDMPLDQHLPMADFGKMVQYLNDSIAEFEMECVNNSGIIHATPSQVNSGMIFLYMIYRLYSYIIS